MGENTKIEWCDHTFNPWSGCQRVSPGCQHCYAEILAKRNPKALGVWGPTGTRVRTSVVNWRKPIQWDRQAKAEGRRYRVFCASMADVFEDRKELVPWRRDLIVMLEQTTNLDWLLLTKRPQHVMPMIQDAITYDVATWFRAMGQRVWIGTSVEDQAAADERIPELLRVPAAVRFLSCEPLLGSVDLSYEEEINWVIAGAESGHGARPMSLDWVRSLRDQCKAAGVPFFFKQNFVNGHKVSLPELDGQQWAQMPQ